MSARAATAVVAVCSRSFSRHSALREKLTAEYPSARFNETGVSLEGDALQTFLAGATHAIVGLERIDGSLLSRLPDLRVISKFGVGLDRIDRTAVEAAGVTLRYTPGVNRRAVAELVLSQTIRLLRQVPEAERGVGQGQWAAGLGRELGASTVGIVGCGHVGKEVVRLLSPFGSTVLAHDLLDFPDFYEEHGVRACPLEELLRESHVVTLHVPFDSSTRHLLDARRLACMRPGAVLVNTARGGVVDEVALLAALESGRLGGAALDVLEDEPPTDSPLLRHPRVLVSPHMGGSSEQAIVAMGEAAIAGLEAEDPS